MHGLLLGALRRRAAAVHLGEGPRPLGVRDHLGEQEGIYSWWTYRAGARGRNVGWRLDYQFATPALAATVRDVAIPREPVMSDHAPVIVTYDRSVPETP